MDDSTGLAAGATLGDEMLFYASLARVRRAPLEEVYQELAQPAFTWHMLSF